MRVDQIINKAVTIGTDPVIIMPELHANVEYVELTVSNQSTGGQTIRFGPSDSDLSEGGAMFLGVGGFYAASKSLGYVISKKQYVAVASGAGAVLYVSARISMEQL